MQFIKFSLLTILLSLSFQAFSAFYDSENNVARCLNANFKTEVAHKGSPLGLLDYNLTVEKNGCQIEIWHKQILKSQWKIDVCRSPIHIKKINGAVEVLKREGSCFDAGETATHLAKTDFCQNYSKLISAVQDDGLIFAEGEKEDFNADHGKIFCAYFLIIQYLNSGRIYSRYEYSDHPTAQELPSTPEQVTPEQK